MNIYPHLRGSAALFAEKLCFSVVCKNFIFAEKLCFSVVCKNFIAAMPPLLLAISFLSVGAIAQTRERTTPKPKTAEQEVRAVITRWATAVKNRDTGALDSI